MRTTTTTLIIGLIVSFGIPAPGGVGSARAEETVETVDGLVKTEIDMPGNLFLRPDHGIGSYDAFLIPEATLSYTRKSPKLPADMEIEFVVLLEQSLIDAAESSDIPVMSSPGECVMQINLGFFNVDLEEKKSAKILGKAVLVMEFRDSQSGQPLLRYATENRIENESGGTNRARQIRTGFDEMVSKMDIGSALRAAGLGDDEIRPGCQGSLAARGRASAPDVSRGPGARESE